MVRGEMLSGPRVSEGTQVGSFVVGCSVQSFAGAARCTPMDSAVLVMSQSGTFVSMATNAVFTDSAVASRTLILLLMLDSEFLNEYVPPLARWVPQLLKSENGLVSTDA